MSPLGDKVLRELAVVRGYQAGFVEPAPLVDSMPWLALAGVAVVTLLAALRPAWCALAMHPAQLLR